MGVFGLLVLVALGWIAWPHLSAVLLGIVFEGCAKISTGFLLDRPTFDPIVGPHQYARQRRFRVSARWGFNIVRFLTPHHS